VTIPRIYHPRALETDRSLELGEEDRRYLKTVLRLKEGDRLVVFDGRGSEYGTRIEEWGEHSVSLAVLDRQHVDFPGRKITLAQSLPKGTKMDFIIQKATELGVSRIVPFVSSRSIPRLTNEKAAARHKRWRRIAIEAAKQCGRATVPELSELSGFEDMLDLSGKDSPGIILWEGEISRGLKAVLTEATEREKGDFFFIVGPEGGFSWQEIETARLKGFTTASLGRNILRTETASLVILSILQYELGAIGDIAREEDMA